MGALEILFIIILLRKGQWPQTVFISCSAVTKTKDSKLRSAGPSAQSVRVRAAATRERKVVAGSNPCRSGAGKFPSQSVQGGLSECADSVLFRYPFYPRVTAVARVKRPGPRSFCQRCRWQVTAKYACTLRRYSVALHDGSDMFHGCSGVGLYWQNLLRDGSSFMWHQPCQRCKYTPSESVDIQKRAVQNYSVTHVESHASAVESAQSRGRRIAQAI